MAPSCWLCLYANNVLTTPRPSPRRPASAASRTPWGWAVSGVLLGTSVAVLAFAPAYWLGWGLAQISEQRLQLLQPRGTVWNGSAQLVLTGGGASQDRASLPGRVSWKMQPSWKGLHAQIHAACCTTAPLAVQVQPQRQGVSVVLADGTSQWPAALLAGLGTPWNTVQLQGQLALSTQNLQAQWAAGRLRLHGQVQLDALALSSRLSTLHPLGSYRITVQGGDVPGLSVQTLQGELQLSGTGQWVGQRLRFTGQASASPGREAALSNFLNLLGRRRGASALITLG